MTMSIPSKDVNIDLSLPLSQLPLPATCPPEERGTPRDEVRLLVLHKATGCTEHVRFHQLAEFLDPGDVVIINTSKTLAASLPAYLVQTGSRLRIHVATKMTQSIYIVERRTGRGEPDETPFQIGERIQIGEKGNATAFAMATVIGRFHPNSRLWYVECHTDLWALSEEIGRPIRYSYLNGERALDEFQTVFARDVGSAEMPSAARPFTARIVNELTRRGIRMGDITLHTGVSSHEVQGPLMAHPFLPEWYRVTAQTADMVNEARRQGRRVIAVGTTVVRALATATRENGEVQAQEGWTTTIITPNAPAIAVTGLITGLHESDTSHLAMLYAFVAREKLRVAYEEAADRGYLWHEFGDSNLIL